MKYIVCAEFEYSYCLKIIVGEMFQFQTVSVILEKNHEVNFIFLMFVASLNQHDHLHKSYNISVHKLCYAKTLKINWNKY